jgi:hypothetical protein
MADKRAPNGELTMEFFWELYQQNRIRAADAKSNRALIRVETIDNKIERLEKTIEQLKLINVAFAELLVEKLGLTEEALIGKINEIDLRDGVLDGKVGVNLEICPVCNRRYNAKFNRCLYCGYSDESQLTILDKLP